MLSGLPSLDFTNLLERVNYWRETLSLENEPEPIWDVVVIGSGMGGAMAARSLAEDGYDVLLVDRGYKELRPGTSTGSEVDDALAAGRWPGPSACEVDGSLSRHFGIFGAGVGGSTNLYAAALERFGRCDLESLPKSPHPTGGWAFKYDQLRPFYEKAEQMLHVAGTPDPLNTDSDEQLLQPPALGPADTDFVRSFATSGLHPYRLHVGIRYRPGCDECLSKLCLRNCRADARSVIAEGRIKPTILERSEAVRLEASADEVTRVVLRQDDRETTVRARVFVLAAGAVHTPKLLLESRGEYWPDGIANRSGMVGRNLMFHAVQQFVMWPGKKFPGRSPRKSICFRDFYIFEGQRLGSVQSSGFEAGYGTLLSFFCSVFDNSSFRRLRILRPLLRIPAALAVAILGPGTIFSCCVEDLPYPDNQVVIDRNEADGVLMRYTVRQELRDRIFRFHELLKKRLGRRRTLFSSPDVVLNLSHACGTCAMGTDPSMSVVDKDCRAHGITNLFITDASFMPTSAAINPSLTIAANALRVSDKIKQVLSPKSKGVPAAVRG
jgi:choline dehydrogenase-like flavoprotein